MYAHGHLSSALLMAALVGTSASAQQVAWRPTVRSSSRATRRLSRLTHRTAGFVGLNYEAIFYDPEALLEPIRIVRYYRNLGELHEDDPFVYVECMPTKWPAQDAVFSFE